MSEFTNPLVLEMLKQRRWLIYENFEYHIEELGSGMVIRVPKGFETDLATIPRLLWPILPPHGYYGKAAVIHDYCYVNGFVSKRWADDIFLQAMRDLKIPALKRILMYWAVRLFGRGNFSKSNNNMDDL